MQISGSDLHSMTETPIDGNFNRHRQCLCSKYPKSRLIFHFAGEPEIAGRPVVDKTGLIGQYDFTLHWASFDPGPAAAPTDPGEQGPSLFTALEEQLGLKLKSEKEQIEVIVVDSVEKPSEN